MVQSTMVVAGMMAGSGLGSTATRFVAQYSKTDPDRAGRIIALITSSSIALILTVGAVITLGADYIARVVLNAKHLQTALVLGTLLMVAMTMRGVQAGVLAGIERFDVIAKLNVLEGVASLIGLVLFAHFFGIEGGLLGLALALFLTWLAGRYALGRTLRNHRISVVYAGSWREKSVFVNHTIPNFLANSLVTPILWFCMTLVTKRLNGYEDLALYHAAYQWHGPLMFIPLMLNSVSMPILVQLWESASFQRFRKVYFVNAVFLLAVSVPPVVAITILSPWAMSLYGSTFRDGWLILILLAAAAPLNALARMGTTALFGMRRAWSVFWLNVIWGGIMLFMGAMLIPKLGALGLASAFFSAYVLLTFLTTMLVLWHLHRVDKPKPTGHVERCVAP